MKEPVWVVLSLESQSRRRSSNRTRREGEFRVNLRRDTSSFGTFASWRRECTEAEDTTTILPVPALQYVGRFSTELPQTGRLLASWKQKYVYLSKSHLCKSPSKTFATRRCSCWAKVYQNVGKIKHVNLQITCCGQQAHNTQKPTFTIWENFSS